LTKASIAREPDFATIKLVIYILLALVIVNLGLVIYLYVLFYRKITTSVRLESLSKIQLLRFNPFSNVGGEQSFTLCLLDNDNCGVIITSLHTPHLTRVYAKNIKNGQSDEVSLSKEEKTVLIKAIKS